MMKEIKFSKQKTSVIPHAMWQTALTFANTPNSNISHRIFWGFGESHCRSKTSSYISIKYSDIFSFSNKPRTSPGTCISKHGHIWFRVDFKSPELRKSNIWALKFSLENFLKVLSSTNRFGKERRIHRRATKRRAWDDTETSLSPWLSMMHTKIHCSSALWVRRMELQLCCDHLCGRGGFLHQERAQTRWERRRKKKQQNTIKTNP